ncbi:MAG: sigma-54 interaction domain-containing protein [Planctomycetota bacterium]
MTPTLFDAADHRPRRASPTMATATLPRLVSEPTTAHATSSPAAGDRGDFGPMLGRSPAMLRLYDRLRRVAPTAATVLLHGETGTGKELAARAIHEHSARSAGPFVVLNCGAVAANLIESELFGHERGSFTGAVRRHHGVFARADHGTLFLDEVTELPLDLQVHLLRVLEGGSFQRLGGEELVHSDARIVAATNRDPLAEVRRGRLREDLYYRLAVFPIALPRLRERDGDVELLAREFLARLNARHDTDKAFGRRAVAHLRSGTWPGNVRQLQNTVQQAYVLADETIEVEHLPAGAPTPTTDGKVDVAVGMSCADAERLLLLATLVHCRGDKNATATMLGISLKTVYSRLSTYSAATTQAS